MATAEFSMFAGILSAALSQNHLLGFEIAQLDGLFNHSSLTAERSIEHVLSGRHYSIH